MKKLLTSLLTICAVVDLVVTMSTVARAVTFQFNPDDLIQLYPSVAGDEDLNGENKATQPNARRTHQPWATSWYETFYNPAAPQTQPDSYNTYINWRDGLGSDEGISGFNIWWTIPTPGAGAKRRSGIPMVLLRQGLPMQPESGTLMPAQILGDLAG